MVVTKIDYHRKLGAVIGIVEEVHNHYPRMELGQLRVLLRVLEKPGTRASELMTLTGLSKSALSRAVRVLGSDVFADDSDGKRREGLNLITQVADPFDNRAKLIAPTILGRRLGEAIDKALGDLCNG